MNEKNKKNKGFSLVELIIVIAIMAILAGVLVPQFVKYINRAGVSADIDQAQNIYNALASQYADDMVATGSATSPLSYDATPTWHEVTGGVAQVLSLGSSAPKSRAENGAAFWYQIKDDGTDIKVGIGTSGSVTEVVPAASGAWANSNNSSNSTPSTQNP